MRVAVIHDALTQYGGAERVLEQIKALYPDAPVMVAIHDAARLPALYRTWDIRASRLSQVPLAKRKHRLMLPFYPQAIESFDLSGYDLVVSSSYAFAHGVLTSPGAVHVNYCHSPARFLWDYHRYADRERFGGVTRMLLSSQLARLRQWDRLAAERPDAWVTTSRLVHDRVSKFYGKTSAIIPPSVDVSKFDLGQGDGGYYLMLMRLVGWKRPDIVIDACTRLAVPLIVAGGGRDLERLRRTAGPTVRFLGPVDDAQMRPLYRDCKALILPSEEDFGITPLEAMASGRPVIAFGQGGVRDTVLPGVTGVFFDEQTAEALMDVLSKFAERDFDPQRIRRHALGYDDAVFRNRLERFINGQLGKSRQARVISDIAPALPPFVTT
jgi:glycosyltransferase involved in cell wall biosynthesis